MFSRSAKAAPAKHDLIRTGKRPQDGYDRPIMSDLTLVIGNRNYSSWSLRPWLALTVAGVTFDEIMIPLQQPDTKSRILRRSPSGKVPALIDGDPENGGRVVWDSLAICEYVAERCPETGLWPDDADARAHARSVSAEMHSGFPALRDLMPMNIKARHPGCGMTQDVGYDVLRINAIWRECRAVYAADGPYLFGRFSIADCLFAPVVFRFRTYEPPLLDASAAYVEAMLDHPAMRAWEEAALAETETIPAHDKRYA